MFIVFLYIELDPAFYKIFKARLLRLIELHKNGPTNISKYNLELFEYFLFGKHNYKSDIKWLRFGFPLWLSSYFPEHKHLVNKLYKQVRNFVNSKEEVIAIMDKFIEEAEKGQIIAYNGKIHYFLGIHCVPKKDSQGNYTKFRVIRNGSIADKHTISLNNLIRKIKCKMPSLPNIKKYASLFLKNNYFALRDLKDCFRYIPLFSEDQQYVTYCLFGMVWKDCAQPYGVSSAPSNAQYFASLLIWILNNKIFKKGCCDNTLVHIDDFVICAATKLL